jgi:hypothetical protein
MACGSLCCSGCSEATTDQIDGAIKWYPTSSLLQRHLLFQSLHSQAKQFSAEQVRNQGVCVCVCVSNSHPHCDAFMITRTHA